MVDTLEPDPIHGAAIIAIDEELNVATIRMFNQGVSEEDYRVCVEGADGEPLVAQLRESVRPEEEPWKSFSPLAHAAVNDHRQNLKFKVDA